MSMKDKLFFFVGLYGEVVGLSIITAISLFDIVVTGARGFFEYAIAWKGIVAIWVGLVLIIASKHLEKKEW